MSQADAIARALESVKQYLGKNAHANSPATAEQLNELQAYVGPLSDELAAYLSTHNGLRINGESLPAGERLWDIDEILAIWAGYDSAALPEQLAPISGDPTGRRDWLILNGGELHGAVLRWNPWSDVAEVIASGLTTYIDAWACYIRERDGNGKTLEFDAKYVAKRDKKLELLRRHPAALARCIDTLQLVAAGKGCPRD